MLAASLTLVLSPCVLSRRFIGSVLMIWATHSSVTDSFMCSTAGVTAAVSLERRHTPFECMPHQCLSSHRGLLCLGFSGN